MDSKKLCKDLLKAESEQEVQAIIDESPEMSDSDNWYPLGGNDTNFKIVNNQASNGAKASTELMTNMVDAMLLKAAHKEGIDPKSPSAPKTIYEAVRKLIYPQLPGGKLINAEKNWLRDYSRKNLVIGITGPERARSAGASTCFTFCDKGEGQHPHNFETTFLSFGEGDKEGDKKDIPFVQGKYNMGSSGVLNFCGNWFKLTVSRRYDQTGEWGWTLMRKRPEHDRRIRYDIADYFKINGKIPSFVEHKLYPLHEKGGEPFAEFSLQSGTIIKLYDFFLGKGITGFSGPRDAFNENLVETILPFRLYDFRYNPDPKKTGLRARGIDERSFHGMKYSLIRSDDKQDSDGEILHVFKDQDPDLGTIDITAIVLKKKEPEKYLSRHRVFHAVNGQVQFKEIRGFLSHCGYPALKDRVVIIVDVSQLEPRAHKVIWKGDREHILETREGGKYKSVVSEAVKKSDVLKDLQQKIRREVLAQTTKKEEPDLLQKLVNLDRNFENLLNDSNPSIGVNLMQPKDDYKGKHSPTFLQLERKFNEPVEIPINKRRHIFAKTDVVNDYFVRPDNTGELYIFDDGVEKYFRIGRYLKDGRLTVDFTPLADKGLSPGMNFSFKLGLYDLAMPETVKTETLRIIVGEEQAPSDKKSSPSPPKPKKPNKGLPKYKLLTKDGLNIEGENVEQWPQDFNELDGGTVEDLGEDEMIYKINYDNAYHSQFRLRSKNPVDRDVATKRYILGMRIFMLAFEHALRRKKKSKDSDESFLEYEDDFRRIAAAAAASVILTLTETLPKIGGTPEDEPE